MISKEQLSDEDSYEFASKRVRLLEPIDDLAPVKDILPPDNGPQKSSTSGTYVLMLSFMLTVIAS